MRVLTILARFGTAQYPDAEAEIAEIFRRRMPEVDRTILIVDNALPMATIEQGAGHTLIGGDNSAGEFSAFDRAIRFVGSDIWSYDLVHVATSAFNTLYVSYLERCDLALLAAVAQRPICAGHIDCYNQAVEVIGFRTQHWIRSCFFFLTPTEAKALAGFVTIGDASRFFSGDPEAPFRHDAPLSAVYRAYITSWLTGGDIGQGVTWHSSYRLTTDTLPSFERKAVAIMNEQLLGVRLRALGCRLVDITWLATMLAAQRPSSIHWDTSWREQLASRDRDAVVVPVS
jgi:hypothetical protein